MKLPFAARLTFFVLVILICSAFVNVFAANNPVPFVNQPLVPASVAPGGNNFQLTVNGTGFVSGSTVNWNGSPRATSFVNQGQLTATILSTDIATASTASITVTSPAPGGGASSVAFLPVRNPSSFVSLNASTIALTTSPEIITAGDFNRDGNQDIAIYFYDPTNQTYGLSIMLGHGDGTFTQGATYTVVDNGSWLASTDVNDDGNLDLVFNTTISNQNVVAVMLGDGDGTFQSPIAALTVNIDAPQFADFNHDGRLDLVYGQGPYCIALGNGDGTFQLPSCTQVSGQDYNAAVVGDFNRDGKLDLALANYNGPFSVDIALGNGDGTFQTPQDYADAGSFYYMAVADFNGDGYLDIAALNDDQTGPLTTFFGNGEGALRSGPSVPTPYSPQSIAVADMNGDGYPDFVGGTYYFPGIDVWISLGNGDGTFQKYVSYGGGSAQELPVLGDFNNDGRMDVAVPNYGLDTITILAQDNGTVMGFSPGKLGFPLQPINSVSQPKVITVTNNGTSAVIFSSITTAVNFSELSDCKTVQPGGSCKVGVYFTPTVSGDIHGYLALADNGGGSPQLVELSGVATEVQLEPTSLVFGSQTVGSISKAQNVILTNNGKGQLQIKEIAIGGTDKRDFYEVNACPSSLPSGKSCTISVIFRPTAQGARSAVLGVADNGGGSPQTVALSGTGT